MDIRRFLKRQMKSPYYKRLIDALDGEDTIPNLSYVHTPLLKVENPSIIVFGQDPYPSGVVEFNKYKDYYDGNAFSTRTVKTPRSLQHLQNSFMWTSQKEKREDIKINNNLSYLNYRGVILTNIYPIVVRNKPLSCPQWFEFSKRLVSYLDRYDISFILLGNEAKRLEGFIKNNQVFKDVHPSSLSYKTRKKEVLDVFYRHGKNTFKGIKWTK